MRIFRKLIPALLVFFSVWALYLNSLDNEFQFDDIHSIKDNRSIRSLDNIPSFFTDPTTFSDRRWMAMYRPVLVLSYAINYRLGGAGVTGFNVGNILIHAINALLVYSVLLLFYPGSVPFAGSMFFGLASISTQAVNYKSSRSVLLVVLFVLLAFRLYIMFSERSRQERDLLRLFWPYIFSLIFYALGLLTKSIAIMFPVILVLYDLLFVRPKESDRSSFLAFCLIAAKRHIPFWIISLIYLMIRKSLLGVATVTINRTTLFEEGVPGQVRSIMSNVATQIMSDFIYLRESIVPYGLSPVHEIEDAPGFSDWRVLALFLLFAALFAMLFRLRGRDPLLLFGFLWFFVALIPETVIPLNIKVNESRAYFPIVGLSLFAAGFCNIFFLKYGRVAKALFFCYLVIIAAVSINRNMVWNDGWSLWSDTVKKAPNSGRAYFVLGSISNNNKNYKDAIYYFERAIELNPLYYRPYNLLGVVLFKIGRVEDAIKNLETAVRLGAYDSTTYYNLGVAYARQNNFEKAGELFKKSLERKADFVPAIIDVGRILEMKGNFKGALARYEEALRLEPDNSKARGRADSVMGR